MQVELTLEELETLASALVRLKFEDNEPPEPYFGSPRLAAAHHRIVDSIISESEQIRDSRRMTRWQSWRKWSTRKYERGVIALYASSLEVWDEWAVSQKIEFLKTCSAPFEPNDEELEELRSEIEARRISSSSDGSSRGV
ncbi:hypothetical protein [Streptomyces alboflavus]|uniref:hypothetical protein n=1 Tax=Streptomyces alboflavus TaxID=67267 RepID=UPI0036B0CD91